MGTVKEAEHGPGAGLSTGRQSRVRPLKRLEMCTMFRRLPRQCVHWLAMTFFFFAVYMNQGGTASILVALGVSKGDFFIFRRGAMRAPPVADEAS